MDFPTLNSLFQALTFCDPSAGPELCAGLSPVSFWTLVALSFFTSLLTAAMGVGGGSVLLAAIAQILPVAAIIPVHGTVQLGSNAGRALLFFKHIQLRLFFWFALGSLIGATIGGQIVVTLPADWLLVLLGVFILYSTWAPTMNGLSTTPRVASVGGLLSTLLSMFVGATGPLVVAMFRGLPSRAQQLGTVACCMVFKHGGKVLIFIALGFAFQPYLMLIILMISSGFLGTLAGKRMLKFIPEALFKTLLGILLSLMAVRLMAMGLYGILTY